MFSETHQTDQCHWFVPDKTTLPVIDMCGFYAKRHITDSFNLQKIISS